VVAKSVLWVGERSHLSDRHLYLHFTCNKLNSRQCTRITQLGLKGRQAQNGEAKSIGTHRKFSKWQSVFSFIARLPSAPFTPSLSTCSVCIIFLSPYWILLHETITVSLQSNAIQSSQSINQFINIAQQIMSQLIQRTLCLNCSWVKLLLLLLLLFCYNKA